MWAWFCFALALVIASVVYLIRVRARLGLRVCDADKPGTLAALLSHPRSACRRVR